MRSVSVSIGELTIRLIAFYFPGRESEVDKVCGCGFLGNFYEVSVVIDGVTFLSSETAYQALKVAMWLGKPLHAVGMQNMTAEKALHHARKVAKDLGIRGVNDEQACRLMWKILSAKFKPGSQLAHMLIATGDAFLLEHKEHNRTSEPRWSNDHNGTGFNLLGLLLMILRARLRGEECTWADSFDLGRGIFMDDEKLVLWLEHVKIMSHFILAHHSSQSSSSAASTLGQPPRIVPEFGQVCDVPGCNRMCTFRDANGLSSSCSMTCHKAPRCPSCNEKKCYKKSDYEFHGFCGNFCATNLRSGKR